MYVIFDHNALVYRRKQKMDVLLNLHYIECQHAETSVYPCDSDHTLLALTPYELLQLYKNTTGQVPPTMLVTKLVELCKNLALAMPPDDVNPLEVAAQANTIALSDKASYQFVPGSNRPAKKSTGLFDGVVRTVSADAKPLPVQVAPQRPALPATESEPVVPVAPKSGSIREIIWSVASDLWIKAGKPADTKEILALRKQAMDVLEREYSVKRNTSSNELGNWQKSLVASN